MSEINVNIMPTFCIEVKRGGIGEEDLVLHREFDSTPTRDEVIKFLESEDMGYDDNYCSFDIYQV